MTQKIFNFFSKVVRNYIPDHLPKFQIDLQGGRAPYPPLQPTKRQIQTFLLSMYTHSKGITLKTKS